VDVDTGLVHEAAGRGFNLFHFIRFGQLGAQHVLQESTFVFIRLVGINPVGLDQMATQLLEGAFNFVDQAVFNFKQSQHQWISIVFSDCQR